MDEDEARNFARQKLQQKNDTLKKRLDNVTRMLCGVMHGIGDDATNEVIRNVEGLKEWWTEHQRLDALREANERKEEMKRQLKQTALAKLSDVERKALGL
jgi:hypothetical protein